MEFDDLLNLKPVITLGELIQLFLLGYDDKIYIDIEDKGEYLEHIRIIDSELEPYYERKIQYLSDSCDSKMTVGLQIESEDKL